MTEQATPQLLKLLPYTVAGDQPLELARRQLQEQLVFLQTVFPGAPRKLILRIEGDHRTADGRLTDEAFDWLLQLVAELGRYFSRLDIPIGHFRRAEQRNDIPQLAAAE